MYDAVMDSCCAVTPLSLCEIKQFQTSYASVIQMIHAALIFVGFIHNKPVERKLKYANIYVLIERDVTSGLLHGSWCSMENQAVFKLLDIPFIPILCR